MYKLYLLQEILRSFHCGPNWTLIDLAFQSIFLGSHEVGKNCSKDKRPPSSQMQPLALAHSLTLIIDVAAAFPNTLWLLQGTCSPPQQVLPSVNSWVSHVPFLPKQQFVSKRQRATSAAAYARKRKSDSLWVRCQNFDLVFQSEASHLDVNHCESYLLPVMNKSQLRQGQRGFADFF